MRIYCIAQEGKKEVVICLCVYAKSLRSCPTLCDLWTAARQAMGFSRQEYWSGLPYLFVGHVLN